MRYFLEGSSYIILLYLCDQKVTCNITFTLVFVFSSDLQNQISSQTQINKLSWEMFTDWYCSSGKDDQSAKKQRC